jgi:hypothetical protein
MQQSVIVRGDDLIDHFGSQVCSLGHTTKAMPVGNQSMDQFPRQGGILGEPVMYRIEHVPARRTRVARANSGRSVTAENNRGSIIGLGITGTSFFLLRKR